MHELSIAMSILEAVEEQSRQRGGARITAVHLKVGPLSGVVPEALQGAFEMAREQSDFADCKLIITETQLLIRCATCQTERSVKSIQQMSCDTCGTPAMDVAGGREL